MSIEHSAPDDMWEYKRMTVYDLSAVIFGNAEPQNVWRIVRAIDEQHAPSSGAWCKFYGGRPEWGGSWCTFAGEFCPMDITGLKLDLDLVGHGNGGTFEVRSRWASGYPLAVGFATRDAAIQWIVDNVPHMVAYTYVGNE